MIRRPCGSGPRTLGPRVRAEIHVTDKALGGGSAVAIARLAALDALAEEGIGSAEYVSPHAEIAGVLDILHRVAGA